MLFAIYSWTSFQHNHSMRWCITYTTSTHSPCNLRCVVTAKTQHNLKNAQEYFEEHLCVGDYYDEGQRVAGEWIGLGAERLGLSGKVRAEDFLRLCENRSEERRGGEECRSRW